VLKVAYLQSAASGHTDSCLRALLDRGDVSLFLSLPGSLRDAPYDRSSVPAEVIHLISSFDRDRSLERSLQSFRPDLLMVVSWHHSNYRWCLRGNKSAVRVLCMDNQWLATPKQRLGVLTSPIHVKRYYDAAFLPGSRQRDFALRLGFPADRIFEGFYSADPELFSPQGSLSEARRRNFLFVGRLVVEKGIDVLVEAYSRYRAKVDDPWGLIVAGTGPEAERLSADGVQAIGFVQPVGLPALFQRSRFLMVPSNFEPFGVVVHEATRSGLGVICTRRVGAGETLVDDGSNGRVVREGDVEMLLDAMLWAHRRSDSELETVRDRSLQLAQQYSPTRWASTVIEMAEKLRQRGTD
jgi:glycosyltransferase involved in cell wall biosynthesis